MNWQATFEENSQALICQETLPKLFFKFVWAPSAKKFSKDCAHLGHANIYFQVELMSAFWTLNLRLQ